MGYVLRRPGDQLLDGLVIVRAEFAALRRRRQEHVLIEEALTQQRLADREEVVAGGRVVLLRAEDQAHLPGGIDRTGGRYAGRDLDDVLENRLSRFILQFGFLRRAERHDHRDEDERQQASGRLRETSIA